MISSCSENWEHPWWSRFSIVFSWKYNISWNTAVLFVLHFYPHYQASALWRYPDPLNVYQCHWSLAKKELVLSCFWPVPACSLTCSGHFERNTYYFENLEFRLNSRFREDYYVPLLFLFVANVWTVTKRQSAGLKK